MLNIFLSLLYQEFIREVWGLVYYGGLVFFVQFVSCKVPNYRIQY